MVARACVPHVNGEAAQRGEAQSALNVREQESSLQVTGKPSTIGAIAPGERLLLLFDGHRVTVNDSTVKIDGNPVVTIEGTVLAAHAVGELIVVVADSGLTYLSAINGSWDVLNRDDAVPALEFTPSWRHRVPISPPMPLPRLIAVGKRRWPVVTRLRWSGCCARRGMR